MANGFKGLTQKEVREKLIRDRAARKKQKEKLAKRKAEASEFTDYMSRSNSPLVKLAKERLDGRAGAKVTKGRLNLLTPKAAKADTKTTASQKKKTDDKRAAATRAAVKAMPKSDPRGNQIKPTPGTATKNGIKEPTKKFNVGVSKGGVSFKEAFKHFRKKGQSTFTWNGKKYTTNLKKAKPKASIKTPLPADFTAVGPKKPAPKKKTTTKSKDPRKDFSSKATPGKKSKIPAGAKKFTGTYDSKTHKLQNIGGKTYVVPRGK